MQRRVMSAEIRWRWNQGARRGTVTRARGSMARRALARIACRPGGNRGRLVRHRRPLIGRRIGIGRQRRHRHREPREHEHARTGEQRQPHRAQGDRAQRRHHAEHRDLAADQHEWTRLGHVGERAEREPEGQRPVGLLVARGRRQPEHDHDDDDREHAGDLDADRCGQPTHRGAPNGRGVAAEPRHQPPTSERGGADGGEHQCQLEQKQPPIRRAQKLSLIHI